MHPIGHEVHPQPEQESIFRTVFTGRVTFGGVFRRSACAPPRQNPGYTYGSTEAYSSKLEAAEQPKHPAVNYSVALRDNRVAVRCNAS